MPDTADLLRHAAERSIDYLEGVAPLEARPVRNRAEADGDLASDAGGQCIERVLHILEVIRRHVWRPE